MRRGLVTGMGAVLVGVTLVACTDAPPQVATTESAVPSQPATPPDPTGIPPIAVVSIASVDVDGLHLTVGGFVTNAEEDGGACRFLLTSEVSGAMVTASTTGIANVGTTSCGTTQVAVDQLSRGPWNVVLEYQSETLSLRSDPTPVEVP